MAQYIVKRTEVNNTIGNISIIKEEVTADDFEICKIENSLTFYKVTGHDRAGDTETQNVAYFPLESVVSVQLRWGT